MKTKIKPPSPAPKKRGRPLSGVERKEQVRLAVVRHRQRLRDQGERESVSFELCVDLMYQVRRQSESGHESQRDLVERLVWLGFERLMLEGKSHYGAVNKTFVEVLMREFRG